jgi:N-methylhydantoinase A
MSYRLGVDIGGTFTDFVLLHRASGATAIHKSLSTPNDPSRAVLAGADELLARKRIAFAELEGVVHGTTLVTNAVIERKGARTGMLVTAGFRDVLDIGKEYRYDLFDLRIGYPEPLVPLALRRELDERIHFDGRIERELDLEQVREAVSELVRDRDIEAIAVCFLHAYANPMHERRAGELIARAFPQCHVSLSSDVAPFMRELERWTTTIANAYTQPMVDRYLDHLLEGLRGRGFVGRLHVMNSGGGTMRVEAARRLPVRLMESGPAAGVLMSARYGEAQRDGAGAVLAFDMGGTTTKGALIRDHRPLRRYEIEVARVHGYRPGSGLPLRIPALDLIEIGSGGGGIAGIDQRGLIQVGPESAGADPGPACYALGGEEATLTDANLVLGYLDGDAFLGGHMRLDAEAAKRAIERRIVDPLGLELARAAFGIHETVNEDVARAFRVHAAERGFDYRGCSMIAFGGSGPVHALRVAGKLKVARVVFPPGAGVMSAFGLLVSPLGHEIQRSERILLRELDGEGLDRRLLGLSDEAKAPLREADIEDRDIALTRRLDMRYLGQGYEIEVELPEGLHGAELLEALPGLFARAYEHIFSISFLEQPPEIVHWKVEAKGPVPAQASDLRLEGATGTGAARRGVRPAYLPARRGFVECPVYERYRLEAGARIEGPALIEEPESTILLGAGDVAVVQADGHIVATPRSGSGGTA